VINTFNFIVKLIRKRSAEELGDKTQWGKMITKWLKEKKTGVVQKITTDVIFQI
jgi:hypothetical protein